MIYRTDPRILMLVGFGLMVLGVGLPLFMILNIIPSTLFLGFFSYAIYFIGLMMGLIGIVLYMGRFKNRR